jgi:hypothetical protein
MTVMLLGAPSSNLCLSVPLKPGCLRMNLMDEEVKVKVSKSTGQRTWSLVSISKSHEYRIHPQSTLLISFSSRCLLPFSKNKAIGKERLIGRWSICHTHVRTWLWVPRTHERCEVVAQGTVESRGLWQAHTSEIQRLEDQVTANRSPSLK